MVDWTLTEGTLLFVVGLLCAVVAALMAAKRHDEFKAGATIVWGIVAGLIFALDISLFVGWLVGHGYR